MSVENRLTGVSPNIITALEDLRHYIEVRDFAGVDPYDALNSPVLRLLSMGTRWGRIGVIQGMKRCPIDLRRVLWIKEGHNPKALALILEGYVRLAGYSQNDHYQLQIRHLLGLLAGRISRTHSGHGWGYNFDWQSRAFFVPKYTPSIVCSAFVGHALLDTYEWSGNEYALDLASPVSEFFLKDLNRIHDGDTFCFSYTAVDDYAVHNANLLGASFLIRLSILTGNGSLRDAALCALSYSMKYQRDDGSWCYSERKGLNWIDSFHTGFNLEAIRWFLKLGAANDQEVAFHAGEEFYAKSFFLADGAPKYYHDRLYPIDIHSAAEAIYFFCGEGTRYRSLASAILIWTMKNMRNRGGSFCYRKGKLLTNRIPYMRWSQAWMFRALAVYAATETSEAIRDVLLSEPISTHIQVS